MYKQQNIKRHFLSGVSSSFHFSNLKYKIHHLDVVTVIVTEHRIASKSWHTMYGMFTHTHQKLQCFICIKLIGRIVYIERRTHNSLNGRNWHRIVCVLNMHIGPDTHKRRKREMRSRINILYFRFFFLLISCSSKATAPVHAVHHLWNGDCIWVYISQLKLCTNTQIIW